MKEKYIACLVVWFAGISISALGQAFHPQIVKLIVDDSVTQNGITGAYYEVVDADSGEALEENGSSMEIISTGPFAVGRRLFFSVTMEGYYPCQVKHQVEVGNNLVHVRMVPIIPHEEPEFTIDGVVRLAKNKRPKNLRNEQVKFYGLHEVRTVMTDQAGRFHVVIKESEITSVDEGITMVMGGTPSQYEPFDSLIVLSSRYIRTRTYLQSLSKELTTRVRIKDPLLRGFVANASVRLSFQGRSVFEGRSDADGFVVIKGAYMKDMKSFVMEVSRPGVMKFSVIVSENDLKNPIAIERKVAQEFQKAKRAKVLQVGGRVGTNETMAMQRLEFDAMIGLGSFPNILLGLGGCFQIAKPEYFGLTSYPTSSTERFRQASASILLKAYLQAPACFRYNFWGNAAFTVSRHTVTHKPKASFGGRLSLGVRVQVVNNLGLEVGPEFSRSVWTIKEHPNSAETSRSKGSLGLMLRLDIQLPFY